MEYPSLSLKQDLIDRVFSKTNSGIQGDNFKVTPSPGAIRAKLHRQRQKELLLHNPVLEECDQCDFKTSKYKAMYRHKRENHTVVRQKCPDCEYSNIYPNRIKTHYKQVHMGVKRARLPGTCRRQWCQYFGTAECLELQEHSLFTCNECKLSFSRGDDLKFHKEKIHLGLVYKCDICETYSTGRKGSLARHMISKHSDIYSKEVKGVRPCTEEGCKYIDTNGGLKQHIETKHEGIVRYKCHVMNCSFGSPRSKDLRRHMKTHDSMAVDLSATKYTCPSDVCNYETTTTNKLLHHTKKCKHLNCTSFQGSKLSLADNGLSNKDKEVMIEPKSDKSQKVLCNISGCDFISDGAGQGQSKLEDHFRNRHKDKELSKDSFISLNSAMAEAMEILREIREIKERTR